MVPCNDCKHNRRPFSEAAVIMCTDALDFFQITCKKGHVMKVTSFTTERPITRKDGIDCLEYEWNGERPSRFKHILDGDD